MGDKAKLTKVDYRKLAEELEIPKEEFQKKWKESAEMGLDHLEE